MNEHIIGSLLFVGLVGTQGAALGYHGLPRWGGRFGTDWMDWMDWMVGWLDGWMALPLFDWTVLTVGVLAMWGIEFVQPLRGVIR